MTDLVRYLERVGVLGPPERDAAPVAGLQGSGDEPAPALDPERVAARWPGSRVVSGAHGVYVERTDTLDPGLGDPGGRVGDALAALGGARNLACARLEDLVLLDLETTGLGRAAGTWAFAVGFLRWRTAVGWVLWQAVAPTPADELALLEAVADGLGGASGLVSYNGRRFDLPLLAARNQLYGRTGVPEAVPHLDLLGVTRRLLAPRIGSCALTRVGERVLGLTRPDGDVPGSQVPAEYDRWLRLGEPDGLLRVLCHNAADLRCLLGLLASLRRLLSEAPHRVLAESPAPVEDGLGLGSAYARLGQTARALEAWRIAFDSADASSVSDTARAAWIRAGTLLAQALKRAGRIEEAMGVWRRLCDAPEAGAGPWEERAKVLEHRAGDFGAALAVVDEALGRDDAEDGLGDVEARRLGPAPRATLPALDALSRASLEHRRSRLRRRLARSSQKGRKNAR